MLYLEREGLGAVQPQTVDDQEGQIADAALCRQPEHDGAVRPRRRGRDGPDERGVARRAGQCHVLGLAVDVVHLDVEDVVVVRDGAHPDRDAIVAPLQAEGRHRRRLCREAGHEGFV